MEKIFANFTTCSHWQDFYHSPMIDLLNYSIGNVFHKPFLQYKGSRPYGLCKFLSSITFHTYTIIMTKRALNSLPTIITWHSYICPFLQTKSFRARDNITSRSHVDDDDDDTTESRPRDRLLPRQSTV